MLKPLNDRVVVEYALHEERTKGGIVIPDTVKEKPAKGTIVAVGPGKRLESGTRQPMSVKVGDVVLFGKYAGTEVELDKKYMVMREDDIMAVIQS
ncbi:co-chaperone GroES [Rickettsiella massiliensis]|uniref:co-chaperone GroES n=1 Tax=Rickettsiella massiliensis TaxID=676517 RepID=UPI00029A9543|nr:co-chaperone GroES [Rickettsiella massiliensis]